MGTGDFRNNLFTTNTATGNAWLTETNKWRVLAGAIPAMSLAVGRAGVSTVANMNMNDAQHKPSCWPNRGGDVWLQRNWLHCDIRNMAYLYTRLVFNEMVQQGALDDD
jgi:hypothetical protein